MGRRGGAKRTGNTAYGSNNTISLREELTGKKQTKGPAVNAKSALKLEHLQRLAVWAGGEASVPSLGAFFAHTLASAQEALGVPPDPSLFTCQRYVNLFCFLESIMENIITQENELAELVL